MYSLSSGFLMFSKLHQIKNLLTAVATHCEKYLIGRNILFNHAWLYGVGFKVKDYSDRKRRKLLLALLELLFLISSKQSFICTIPQTG